MGTLRPINPHTASLIANPQATAHDYDNLTHKPQINGHELSGDQSGSDLGLQNQLTAGDNVTIDENGVISVEGGTDDYNDLDNKPSVNDVELRGNKTLSDLKIQPEIFAQTEYFNLTNTLDGKQFLSLNTRELNVQSNLSNATTIQTSYDIVTYEQMALTLFERGEIPAPECGVYQKFMNEFRDGYQAFYFSYESGKVFRRSYGSSGFSDWQEIELGSKIVSGRISADGRIIFKNSDGSEFITTGASVIGADGFSPTATVTQTASGATVSVTDKNGTTTANISNGADGSDYVLTSQDKSDIADIVLSELPTTQEVLYGNASN